jgi:TolB-like protein/cytochrome c-type biogenesis protein CcmH/NrfG
MKPNNKKDSFQARLENIKLDLGTYKILLHFQDRKHPFVIHFDKPARRFYFSLIALVVTEMKSLDKPEFIYIRKHEKTLKLLDNSLAGQSASKTAKGMWDKIRKAWRYILPDLETAALFKVLDRDLVSPYEKGGKYRYECSDVECDTWANLFGYDENNKWRFKFAIDSASISLNDISVIFGDLRDNSAWKEFVKRLSIQPKAVSIEKSTVPRLWKKVVFSLVAVLIIVAAFLAIWNFYLRPIPSIEVASEKKMAFPLPEKPSIAVLPFANMSGDSSQDYFSDGVTETIITALSHVQNLFVIARHSTFTYKGKPVKVQQVAEELGVRYVLEGSVQRSENRIRISAQLIDALKGHHLWAEKYDRKYGDIFALQDDITQSIVTALEVKLTEGEQARIRRRLTGNPEAYDYFLRGQKIYRRLTKEDNAQARKLFEKAAELYPNSMYLWQEIGWTHYCDGRFGWTDTPARSLALAEELAQKVLAVDDSDALAYGLLSVVYMARRQHDKAVAYGEKALALAPNFADLTATIALPFMYSGRTEEAVELVKKAMRLSPYYPDWYLGVLGMAYRFTGQYKEAIAATEKWRTRNPRATLPYLFLAIFYVETGQKEKAETSVAEVLKRNPKASIKWYAKKTNTFPYKDPDEIERVLDSLRKAGLPE